jgi:hypothetical protein
MKKKLERIDDRMFAPLLDQDAARAVIGMDQTNYISLIQTANPAPDEVIDHG